jgi:polysaccharide export outer membrane protein
MPMSGPSNKNIQEASVRAMGVQFIDMVPETVRLLQGHGPRTDSFAEGFGHQQEADRSVVGKGDTLVVNIWEAPPATLFGAGQPADPRAPATTQATSLPEQVVDSEGMVIVPFAGRIVAAGMSVRDIEAEITRRLKGKANAPEVMVRQTKNSSSTVTVVGEVTASMRMPLSASGERLLDALAAAGGVRQPVSKMTVQVTRDGKTRAIPMDVVIRDPKQNIRLRAGDVVTASFQPLSFTVLGATGKNEEISFETQGISLAQALGRAGGLLDSRAAPQGVYIFRYEASDALDWPNKPVAVGPDNTVPVVYRIDLRDPSSLFVAQGFVMKNKDLLYVSNAPAADLQKFLALIFSVTFPILNTIQVIQN